MSERHILFGGATRPPLEEQLHPRDYIKFFYSLPYTINGDGYQVQGTFRKLGKNLFKEKCVVITIPLTETLLELAIEGFSRKLFRRKYKIEGITRLVILE